MPNYYHVVVKICSYPDAAERQEIIPFKSSYAAVYMAKNYAKCADVEGVDVIDQTTGELIYYWCLALGEWEA